MKAQKSRRGLRVVAVAGWAMAEVLSGGPEMLPDPTVDAESAAPLQVPDSGETPRPEAAWGNRDGGEVWRAFAEKYDKDRSGSVSRDEYTRGAETFSRLDRNHDGELTAADFPARRGGRRAGMARSKLVRMADADGNREVTKAEWTSFLGWEDNGEGTVGVRELGNRLRKQGAGRRADRLAALLDRNGDSEIEEAERDAVWRQFDRDEDGVIVVAELARGRGAPALRGEITGPPEVGAEAPDFELPHAAKGGAPDEERKVRLSSFRGKKPVALVFGSYT